MKRLLFVDHVNRILGGAEINLIELLQSDATHRRWRSVCACVPRSPLSDRLKTIPVEQHEYGLADALNRLRIVGKRFSPFASARSLLALNDARRRLREIIRAVRPSAVVSCTNKDHFAAALAASSLGVPSVWWVNDIISPAFFSKPARTTFRWLANAKAHRLAVVSHYAQRALANEGVAADKITVVHNGIPIDRYQRLSRGALREPLSIPAGEPIIGIIGRYTPWKGQHVLLQVAKDWIERNQRGHFVLIGQTFNEDQDYENELRAFVQAHQLASRIHFVPFQTDVSAALSDLDILIHASIRPEPFGRVIIEAMAVGVPVIAANDGGIPEIIKDGVNGFLATPGHVESYMEKLRALSGRSERLATLIREGEETVRKNFVVERVWKDFDGIIAKCEK